MWCPKCHITLNLIREELRDLDLEWGNLHTTTEYICPECQRTFLTSSYYEVKFIEENFIETNEEEDN